MKLGWAMEAAIKRAIAEHGLDKTEPAERSFRQANDFLLAATRCAVPKSAPTGEQWPAVPIITNMAFACELYLKALLLAAAHKPRGHELRALFDNLPKKVRDSLADRYENLTGTPPARFRSELNDISKAFVDWRYVFEDPAPKPIFLHDLHALARALFRETTATHPSWPVNEALVADIDAALPINVVHLVSIGNGKFARIRME